MQTATLYSNSHQHSNLNYMEPTFVLKKQNKVWDIPFLDLIMYYKAIIIKRAWYWCGYNNLRSERRSKSESHISMVQVILNQAAKNTHWRGRFLQRMQLMALENWKIQTQKSVLLSHCLPKNQLKVTKDLKHEMWIYTNINLYNSIQKKKSKRKLHGMEVGRDFLEMMGKHTQWNKEKRIQTTGIYQNASP